MFTKQNLDYKKLNAALSGYSMVDMAISMSVLALLSVGAMTLVQHNHTKKRLDTTVKNAAKIETALKQFSKRFGYLPCPSRPDVVVGQTGFGFATVYNTSSKVCDDANLVSETGAVPVRTLNLEDNVTYDGWGNKFTYRISEYAGASVDFRENTAFQGSLRVSTLTGTPLSYYASGDTSYRDNGASYILISHGRNHAKDAAWRQSNVAPDPSNITSTEPGAKGEIGNASHAKGQYYQNAKQGVFDDMLFFKRKNHIFPPKRMIAPIAMDRDICQSANMLLRSGSPRDIGTPLNSFAKANPDMAGMARDIFTTANRMKTICDASPLNVFTPTSAPSYLFTWSSNTYADADDQLPTQFGTDTDWKQIFMASNFCAAALKKSGALYMWGNNSSGSLGLGDTIDRHVPTQVGTDTDWQQVSIAHGSTHALKNNGTLYAWGGNWSGQLGLGDTIDRHVPTQVGTDTDWQQVVSGYSSVAALKESGALYMWGSNRHNQFGLSISGGIRNAPAQVGADTDWKQVALGEGITAAIKESGALYGWGSPIDDGFSPLDYGPKRIGTDTDWKQVAAGIHFITAIKENGTLYTGGDNSNGRLGFGDTTDRPFLTQLGTDTDWKQVTIVGSTTTAMKEGGDVCMWGITHFGLPRKIVDGTANWKQILARYYDIIAIK